MTENQGLISSRKVIQFFLIIFISAIFFFFFSSYVPFNMDEFCQFHTLSCHYYPFNQLNVFRESCHRYDLALWGNHYLPLRSFRYVGSFTSFLYAPLFWLWSSPYSARLLGLLMLVAQSYLIYKLLKINWAVSFIFLLAWMPYVFQHLVDVGPIAFQTTSVFIIAFLAKKWAAGYHKNFQIDLFYPFCIGLMIFFGIWTKVIYLVMLPGVFLLISYYLIKIIKKIKNLESAQLKARPKRESATNALFLQILILIISASHPSLFLLNAKDRGGYKYYSVITASSATKTTNLQSMLRVVNEKYSSKLAKYLFNPFASAHRIFATGDEKTTLSGILLTAIFLTIIFWGLYRGWRRKQKWRFGILNFFLFLFTFFLICLIAETKAMHHVVLSFPFLILSLASFASQIPKGKLLLFLSFVFLAVNFYLYFTITKADYRGFKVPFSLELNNLVNQKFGDRYVMVVIDWGIYYLKALYGPKNQCVLYMEVFRKPTQVSQAKKVLAETKRKVLFIARTESASDLALIKQNFPDLVKFTPKLDMGQWTLWYEP